MPVTAWACVDGDWKGVGVMVCVALMVVLFANDSPWDRK
jgi:hypothetical protein